MNISMNLLKLTDQEERSRGANRAHGDTVAGEEAEAEDGEGNGGGPQEVKGEEHQH